MRGLLASVAAVALGGSLGATVRYLTSVIGVRLFGGKFPVETVARVA